jgi:Ca2+/Na+ antiporter
MEKRVKKDSDYWFDILFGGFLTFIIIYYVGNLILSKLDLDFLNIYYLFFCLIIVIYYQWKDDNYEIIANTNSRNDNFELVKRTLEELNWEYKINSIEVELTYNKYILKFLNVSIKPKSKNIYINFKYYSTTKTGRLPFFFGISTFLKWKFLKKLKMELNKKPNG